MIVYQVIIDYYNSDTVSERQYVSPLFSTLNLAKQHEVRTLEDLSIEKKRQIYETYIVDLDILDDSPDLVIIKE